jgi:hypothetical protein
LWVADNIHVLGSLLIEHGKSRHSSRA